MESGGQAHINCRVHLLNFVFLNCVLFVFSGHLQSLSFLCPRYVYVKRGPAETRLCGVALGMIISDLILSYLDLNM